MARNFFTVEEQECIRSTTQKAEARTSGEIATMVVPQSDDYREADYLGAILLSGLLSLVISVAVRHVSIWTYVPLVCLGYYPLLLVLRRVPRLKLGFIGRVRIATAVRSGAVRAFFEKGLYRTRDETGILIYISLLERKVWILGDRGINSKIPPDFWQHLAGELASGIRKGNGCDTLCRVITACGLELERHFPLRSDDKNELPDHLII
ncbi:TPM domain-containing protein [Geobacter sp. DSM 9736]|uniref:TPM domain-containing protein n=1 Tax=Geobacter sp. DSM 9736 TaxID=1277350 RepID=UPI000B609A2A|nr:hypothetical protein [Geobacter sp. DSM 9736]SNB45793.1 putative membrane protein [Geobacter sp. DSM 9736]